MPIEQILQRLHIDSMPDGRPTLVVLLGPTGVGKTASSFVLAEQMQSPIISADSRQVFRELRIGSAAPTAEELRRVTHYFIGTRSVVDNYSAGQYETDALRLLQELFQKHDALLMVGGSMMYIDAVCRGLDDVPAILPEVRKSVQDDYNRYGLTFMQEELHRLDEKHYNEVDLKNYRRVMHAVEVCRQTGRPYSDLRRNSPKTRPFRIIKIGLNLPRELLYDRINRRVDQMIEDGLIEEAQALTEHRHLPALNTVGYKELFNCFDGIWTRRQAIDMIRQDSRRYAKRQLTWFRADNEIHWFEPQQLISALS